MDDANYNAHIHINKEPRCEQSQKKQIIVESDTAYLATAPALALIARLRFFFFRQCSPRCVVEHNAIALPLTPRSDNLIATLQQLGNDYIE
jgi:hypothetical protein